MQTAALKAIYMSTDYENMLKCANEKVADGIKNHVIKLTNARNDIIKASEGEIEAKGEEEKMKHYINMMKKMMIINNLSTDKKYMKFLLESCQKEYIDNEYAKVVAGNKAIMASINIIEVAINKKIKK